MLTEKRITAEMIPAPPKPHPSPSRRILRGVSNFLINLIMALPWFVGILYLSHKAMGLDLDVFWEKVVRDIQQAIRDIQQAIDLLRVVGI